MSDSYELGYDPDAEEELKQLPKEIAKRLRDKAVRIAENAEVLTHKGMTGNWSGHYKERVGDYRLIYQMDKEAQRITIIKVGHRRDVYDD